MTKKQLGQFFTTNSDYILQGFEKYVVGKNITDPFAGSQDLLNWAKKHNAKKVIGYDVDDKYIDGKTVFKNDCLANPLKYDFILTNPPYLYVNKMEAEQKSVFKGTKHTDLYQLSLEKIMDCKEGIAIVPINFLSSENAKYIREIFLNKFEINAVNFFTQAVFPDTTYTVMAFYFCRKVRESDEMNFPIRVFPPSPRPSPFEGEGGTLHKKYNWQIGGEFLAKINKQKNDLGIRRLVEKDLTPTSILPPKGGGSSPSLEERGKKEVSSQSEDSLLLPPPLGGRDGVGVSLQEIKLAYNHLNDIRTYELSPSTINLIKSNIILLKAIDTGSEGGEICLEDIRKYGVDGLVSIPTSRNQIFLIFENQISIKEQEKLIKLFNKEINEAREKYFSLFMTNYRDKNRKRISFNFAYKLINYLYFINFKA